MIFPIPPAPRTAVLVPWFRSNGTVRVFDRGWTEQAAAFAPCAIAATPAQLERLAAAGIPPLSHAVIALTRPGEQRVSESDRDRFWTAFRVPLFEQIVGDEGELLAAECEAHDGLHIESQDLPLDQSTVETSPCACGRKTPRLVSGDRFETLRRVAAYAR